mmetsp:Transcript_12737/g.29042  ORF Transcript_12737/g.29042 Transcript_12737/m.29042 type:complete len:93 (-) Transcript_12737:194-472(-)
MVVCTREVNRLSAVTCCQVDCDTIGMQPLVDTVVGTWTHRKPVHYACKYGHLHVVQFLHHAGASLVDNVAPKAWTQFMMHAWQPGSRQQRRR